MAYWSHNVVQFATSLLLQGRFLILDDTLALVVLICFSVAQIQISTRFFANVSCKRRSIKVLHSHHLFKTANIILCAAYILGAILTVATFTMKLKFISRLAKDGSTPLPCPDDYIHFTSTLCMQKKAASLRQTIHVLDTVTATLFQLSVILSDALLIYRCYIILRGPWSWIISSVASLPLAASFSLLIVLLVPQHAGHNNPLLLWRVATYVSLLTNLIVSATLIIHLRKAAQRLTSLLGHASTTRTRTPYTRIIEMLVEAALPPLVSGIVHLILFAALKTQAITLNVLLLSFTVLAPQTNHRPSQGASEEIPTRPLAFSRSNPSSHIATLSESNSFMESTPQESR